MAQTANEITNGKQRKVEPRINPELPHGQQTSSKFISREVETIELLKELSAKCKEPKQVQINIPKYNATEMTEDYFVDVCKLALHLGLDKELEQLIIKKELLDIAPFLNLLLKAIHQNITKRFNKRKEKMVSGLLEALSSDGKKITLEQYNEIEKSLAPLMLTKPDISFSKESEYNTDPFYLAIIPCGFSLTRHDFHKKENKDFFDYLYSEISTISYFAFLSTDNDALHQNADMYLFEEYLNYEFIANATSEKEILNEIIKNKGHEDLELNEEDFYEQYSDIAKLIVTLNEKEKKHKEFKDSEKTSLLKWFKCQTNIIKEKLTDLSPYEHQGHYANTDFLIYEYDAYSMIQAQSQDYYELCDNNSEIKIDCSPEDTLNALEYTFTARYIFNVFITLMSIGRVSETYNESTIEEFNLSYIESMDCIF